MVLKKYWVAGIGAQVAEQENVPDLCKQKKRDSKVNPDKSDASYRTSARNERVSASTKSHKTRSLRGGIKIIFESDCGGMWDA